MRSLKIEKPLIGIIANSTSPQNREELRKELGEPENGFFSSLKFTYRDLEGEIVPLDIQPNEILQTAGFHKAKTAAFKAVDYLVSRGAKVICFTASTKRLPGKFGKAIKKLYPDIIFTIGDNTTMISFDFILERFLAQLDKENDHVACVGAGFIGEQAINSFIKLGFKNISLVSEYLKGLPDAVKIVDSLEKLPKNIVLMASCSHKYQPDVNSFKHLFAQHAVIIEVSVPPMVDSEIYQSLAASVLRFDAGDFYLNKVDYAFSPKILNFPEKAFWYGCFTEAVMLTLAHLDGHKLQDYNFFKINQANKDLLALYLIKENAYVPLINFFEAQGDIKKVLM